jgi:hypothetical protein
MQSLGTLNGVAFYPTRNADGHFCFAMVRVDGQLGKGFGSGSLVGRRPVSRLHEAVEMRCGRVFLGRAV